MVPAGSVVFVSGFAPVVLHIIYIFYIRVFGVVRVGLCIIRTKVCGNTNILSSDIK